MRRRRAAPGARPRPSAAETTLAAPEPGRAPVHPPGLLAHELRLSLALLARERDDMAALVDTVADGILQLGAGGVVVRANPAARALLGLPDPAEGRPIDALLPAHPLGRVLVRAARGRPVAPLEVTVREHRLLVKVRPAAERLGQGAVVVLTDLTEIERFAGMRRDFVANASHELKTPLTAIRGFTELLLTGDPPPRLRRRFLETIQRHAERLHRIVEDLLDLSRLESGGWRPETEAVDPVAAAADAWAGLRERARARDVAFHIVCPHPVRVLADPTGLRQVFGNLLDNALRCTPSGGRITVAARAVEPEAAAPESGVPRIAIEVGDTGRGIPRDALPRIFERFYRAEPARSRADGGTGLGLAIVKHLVERMGGDVAAESTPGEGTTIRFHLPAAPTAAARS